MQRCVASVLSLLCLTVSLACQAAPEIQLLSASAGQHLELGSGAGQLPWFSAGSALEQDVSRALIVIHGYPRDLGRSLSAGVAAVNAAELSSTTVVIAPLFPVAAPAAARCSSPDTQPAAADDALWTCSSWIEGGLAEGGKQGAFDAMDRLLADLPRRWPMLRQITLAGFSAGAQFVQHYIGFAHQPAGIALRYVVADPGSWLYLDDKRPVPVRDGQAVGWQDCTAVSGPGACEYTWMTPAACPAALRWKYGLHGLPENLAGKPDEIRARHALADVAYLEGEHDTDAGRGSHYRILDKSCGAQTQGPYRLQRGLAFIAHERAFLHPAMPRPFAIVPGCAHDVACVLPSPAARTLLFPAEASSAR